MGFRDAVTILSFASSLAHGQTAPFSRFTDELPQALESDATTVMTIGVTHDFAAKLCARLGNATGKETENEVAAWRKRNDPFFRAATSVLNELGNRYLPNGGEDAKQGYLQMIVRTAAKEANQRVMRQLNGASLDNRVVPPERACAGLAHLLRDGVADFERTPDVTRSLVPYMQRKGIARPLQDAAAASNRGDFKADLEILISRAESGDVDALGNLGNRYAFGQGVPKDLAKAYAFWSRAAEKHLGTAMFNIAVLYATGQGGLPRDPSQAAAWYKKAAEHRHDQAMITLSSIYATGQGLDKNRQLAVAWASLAATNTKSEQLKSAALNQLRQLASGMSKEEMAETQKIMHELAATIDANVALYRKNAP